MPSIEFIAAAEVRGAEAKSYAIGDTLECSADSAERWIRRGVAKLVEDRRMKAPASASTPAKGKPTDRSAKTGAALE